MDETTGPGSSPLPDATRLGRTALTVGDATEDATAVIDFYRDVVGFGVLTRDETKTTLGVGDTVLLELHHDATAQPRPADAAGLFHNAFRVPDRAALGDALGRIRDRWKLDGASDHGVSEALYCTDPDGNGVELYRDRPREEWPRTSDGRPEIGSWPLDLDTIAAAAGDDVSGVENVSSRDEATAIVPDGTTLGHVHFEVTSLETARTVYADRLGFGTIASMPSALFLAAGGYHHHVGLNTWNGRSAPAAEDARGLAWVEVLVPSADAIDAVRARLDDANDVRLTDVDRDDRTELEIVDPDGITIRLGVDATASDRS